jgi:branched-chain amino acid transport system permease protein
VRGAVPLSQLAAIAAVLFLMPLGLGDYWSYQLALYYLYAIAALGLGLCWGRAGFLPLGQAMFFGLSGYLSGLALIAFEGSAWLLLLLPLAALASGALAYGIGALVFRQRGESGPYFSMITLALSLLAFQIANSWDSVTGGFNGLKGIPGLPGLDSFTAAYYVAAAALLVSLALAIWLLRAPIGVLWVALAQNERRLALFGFDGNQLKAVAFGVSGLLAGIGGALYAPQQGLVTPQLCGFLLSADLVIWAAVGGRARLLGPVIGALVVGALSSALRARFQLWEVFVAALFIAVVLLFPQGIIGVFAPLERWFAPRRRRPDLDAPGRSGPQEAARLEIEDVSARVGEVTILDRLSLAFERPGIFCIIGPNGAGKTSTFNLLTGELAAAAGRVALDRAPIGGLPPHRIVRLGVGRKFQIPTVFTELSIADNLCIALWSGRASRLDLLRPRLRRWRSPMLDELSQRYGFLADRRRKASELSHGERQILELAMALLGEPRLLLLDEPSAGLSPHETQQVIEVIRWASRRLRATVVVIEHDIALVRELAEEVYVLHNGRLLAQGSVADIQANPAVRAVYVGAQK